MKPHDTTERHLSVLDRLELHLIPEDGLAFDEPLPVAWLQANVLGQDSSGLELLAHEPGHARLTVAPIGPVGTRPPIGLRGEVEASASTTCVRCLAAVRVEIEAELDVTLLFDARAPAAPEPNPAPEPDPAKKAKKPKKSKKPGKDDDLEAWDEGFEDPEALDDGSYDAEGIDVPGVIREALLLGMDMNPTCDDEAACDARTQALLDEANKAVRDAEAAGDPRWAAALAALRAKE